MRFSTHRDHGHHHGHFAGRHGGPHGGFFGFGHHFGEGFGPRGGGGGRGGLGPGRKLGSSDLQLLLLALLAPTRDWRLQTVFDPKELAIHVGRLIVY